MITPFHMGKYRVKVDKSAFEIYRQLKGIAFNQFHSLFTLCVALGFRDNDQVKLTRNSEHLFWSDTFTEHEYSAFYSLIILKAENNYELLKDGEKTLELLENYADHGMKIFLDSAIMKNRVQKRDDGLIVLDVSPNDYLSKQIMHYVFNLYQSFNAKVLIS